MQVWGRTAKNKFTEDGRWLVKVPEIGAPTGALAMAGFSARIERGGGVPRERCRGSQEETSRQRQCFHGIAAISFA